TYVGYIHTSKNDTTPTPPTVEQGTVTVNYQDEQGNTVAPTETLKGDVGETYSTVQKDITGYDFKEVQGNTTGVLSNEPIQVIYVYNKKPLADVKITVKFVDQDGNPFTVPDLTTYENGDFVPFYSNLDQYKVQLDYNRQIYNQNQVVPDIVIPGKEGDAYSLPKNMTFNIMDDKGNIIPYLIAPDGDGTDTMMLDSYRGTSMPENQEGTLKDKDIVVTYKIIPYEFGESEP
ncbi:MucBP domain-containing protein, partial [Listeria booriae]|uniref:MucBP domain-containing protein n=1 Tax=Listeria booriae TaxID=1552123 RepID=UPI00164DAEFB